MARCDACGNDYDKSFEVKMADRTATFDSFECAINSMAPKCAQCGNRIIGHGVEAAGTMYCCAHCAHRSGEHEIRDRV